MLILNVNFTEEITLMRASSESVPTQHTEKKTSSTYNRQNIADQIGPYRFVVLLHTYFFWMWFPGSGKTLYDEFQLLFDVFSQWMDLTVYWTQEQNVLLKFVAKDNRNKSSSVWQVMSILIYFGEDRINYTNTRIAKGVKEQMRVFFLHNRGASLKNKYLKMVFGFNTVKCIFCSKLFIFFSNQFRTWLSVTKVAA